MGLAVAAPLAISMAIGSTILTLVASAVALVASVLSPMTGLIALAFMAPFPRPLVIPTPGLYVAIIGAIFLGSILRLPLERPRLRWPPREVLLIGAFLLYVATHFSAVLIDGPGGGRTSAISSLFAQMMTAGLAFVAAIILLRGRSPYPVLVALLSSAFLASAIAVSQSIGASQVFGDLVGRDEVLNRITGPFQDPNYFGAFLAAATTLGVACAVIARSTRLRVLLVALSAFYAIALLLTLSRGALVSLMVGIVVVAFTRSRKGGFAAVAAIILTAIVTWPIFAEMRFGEGSDLAVGGLATQLESSARAGAWLSGLDVFASSPVFGIGWGRFIEEATSGIAAHNWYIAVLAETGIVGLLLWVLFLVASVAALHPRPLPARIVGYSVLSVWVMAGMFIEVPVVFAATGLVLITLATAISADWAGAPIETDRFAAADARQPVRRLGTNDATRRIGARIRT